MRLRSGGPGYDSRVPERPHLTRVPEPDSTPADKVRARITRRQRPEGMLECPRCGGRELFTSRAGVVVKGGKTVTRGTVIVKNGCLVCAKQDISVTMVPGGQGPKLVR